MRRIQDARFQLVGCFVTARHKLILLWIYLAIEIDRLALCRVREVEHIDVQDLRQWPETRMQAASADPPRDPRKLGCAHRGTPHPSDLAQARALKSGPCEPLKLI